MKLWSLDPVVIRIIVWPPRIVPDKLSANINFIGFAYILDDLFGQIFALFVLVVAAAEAAIGLAILTIFFKKSGSISIDVISKMKG